MGYHIVPNLGLLGDFQLQNFGSMKVFRDCYSFRLQFSQYEVEELGDPQGARTMLSQEQRLLKRTQRSRG